MTAYSQPLKLTTHGEDLVPAPAFAPALQDAASHFQHDKFLLNRKVLSLGNKYYLYDENQNPIFFIDRPIFKMKAHIGIYTDESKSTKVLTLFQDSAWAFINQSFTLKDGNDQPVVFFKRQGWASMVRRTWKIFDANNQVIAIAQEDSLFKALLRRFLKDSILALPFMTNYIVSRPDGTKLGEFNRRNLVLDNHVADFTADAERTLDRHIVVGMCILLDNVERTR